MIRKTGSFLNKKEYGGWPTSELTLISSSQHNATYMFFGKFFAVYSDKVKGYTPTLNAYFKERTNGSGAATNVLSYSVTYKFLQDSSGNHLNVKVPTSTTYASSCKTFKDDSFFVYPSYYSNLNTLTFLVNGTDSSTYDVDVYYDVGLLKLG